MSYAVYFYDNRSDDLDYGEINTTDIPICADKGFLCPTLYSPVQLFSYLTTVADFIIISFLVYLSFAKVKDGLFKYFTLNLMAICSVITIADLVIDGINIVNLVANVGENIKNLYQIRQWARRCLSFGNIWSHALALYAAVLCYLAYVSPIFYAKHFVNKNQKLHYIVLHISLFLWNSCIDFIREQFSIIVPYHLTHLVLFIALFVVAIMASFEIYKYKPLGVNTIRVGKLRRERLFSFVSYCCATEIFVLPRFFYSTMSLICNYAGCEYQLRQSAFYSIIRQMIYIFHELNSIIIGLITLIALKPYRHVILSIFQKQKPSLKTSNQK